MGASMKVFWFDCETSGLDPLRHGIISLSYAVEIDGQEVASGELRSSCEGKEIEDSALAVNHFTREQIAEFPPPRELYFTLLDIFSDFVEKYDHHDKFMAGGYNVRGFDMRFLRQLWADQGDSYFGSWFHFAALDPSSLLAALAYMGVDVPLADAKLTDLARHFGMDTTGAHDASWDLKMTRFVLSKLIDLVRATR